MSSFKEMKLIKDKVKFILKNKPQLRDDDNRLLATFFLYEIGLEKLNKMNAMDLLKMIAYGELSSTESIRRVRQKLQEQNPELRGDKYCERANLGNNMKEEIKTL
jgi:hypothetical protein